MKAWWPHRLCSTQAPDSRSSGVWRQGLLSAQRVLILPQSAARPKDRLGFPGCLLPSLHPYLELGQGLGWKTLTLLRSQNTMENKALPSTAMAQVHSGQHS